MGVSNLLTLEYGIIIYTHVHSYLSCLGPTGHRMGMLLDIAHSSIIFFSFFPCKQLGRWICYLGLAKRNAPEEEAPHRAGCVLPSLTSTRQLNQR